MVCRNGWRNSINYYNDSHIVHDYQNSTGGEEIDVLTWWDLCELAACTMIRETT